ncbi:MAG TPA: hypothetical protein H9881_06440 [Candidatus Stackebrandtia excrementipullorum]|nr:hypothetical protein [Candidatus Stackebrandtia excrementipullorum]
MTLEAEVTTIWKFGKETMEVLADDYKEARDVVSASVPIDPLLFKTRVHPHWAELRDEIVDMLEQSQSNCRATGIALRLYAVELASKDEATEAALEEAAGYDVIPD